MAYVAVDADGTEYKYSHKPTRQGDMVTRDKMKSIFTVHTNGEDEWIKVPKKLMTR